MYDITKFPIFPYIFPYDIIVSRTYEIVSRTYEIVKYGLLYLKNSTGLRPYKV